MSSMRSPREMEMEIDVACSLVMPRLWRRAAQDPDPDTIDWLRFGAPAGILHPTIDRGIFPTYDPEVDTADLDRRS